ncbi:MAG TPA: AAA family ATPase, partial [Gemmatimonadales bacterium]|nr:AAA family ATPase [Gemmatimonadales bacterium]
MSIPHQLRCLGYPTLHAPDGSAVRFRVKKHLALLVYLAMAPRIHRRDRLAELLWPAVSEREGRHSLATGLSVLRAKLGHAAIEAGRDTVRLVPGSLELDLDRLAAGDILGSETVPVLAVAPLLEDFDIPDAPGWNQWKDAEAANWQPRIRDALLTLTDRSRRHGDTRAMERLADSLLAIDPLSEEGIRSKMEARAFAGDRLSALKHFEAWKARLADEVGAQPGELVEGMAVRLRRRGWERTNESHIAPVHTDQWKDRPFIGRGAQYRVLYEAWESTERGAPRHAIITGDSGVGKSTLAERLATAAGLQGAVSAREQCHEVARDVPYAAIGGLAVGLLDKPGASTIAPEWLGELGRAVSEVRRRFPHAPPPLEAEGETVRIRIADAFVELVNAVAEEQPVILILDDLHLADDASVSVLHLLLRRLERQRVQVLLTARPGEISNGGNAQRLVERADQVGLSGVAVPPLSPEEASELLDSLVATRGEAGPTPAARRALLQAAAGYPMVLELLTDDWHTHGERCLALSLGGMTEQAATEGPGAMYARILERLTAELDPTSHNVLNLAAVLGARLNDFALYGLADLTLAQTMAGLSRLAAVRILRDAGEGLEFINELMRAQVYVAVPSSVRRVLHSKVADQLIARADGGEPLLGLEIAWHCIR